jgi:transposase
VARANQLIQAFLTLVRERRGQDLEVWIAEATHSGIDELARFARGLEDDVAAITAGLTLKWSNGPVAGQITRLSCSNARAMVGLASPCSGSVSCRPPRAAGD